MTTANIHPLQGRTLVKRDVSYHGWDDCIVRCKVEYGDPCGNGHSSLSITGEVYCKWAGPRESDRLLAAGCIHDVIAREFPEVAPYLKWHLCSTDGPLHYYDNTLYLAGDRDCWGLRQFERNASGRVGQGKERELDAARQAAIWPDATDEELMADDLRGRMEARLPALMDEFRAAVESLGFTY